MAGNPSTRHFLVDQRGNFAIIFAICLLPIMALAGAAVDYSRIRAVESRLQDAADAGALAAAAGGHTVAQRQRMAEDFVAANAHDLDASVKTTVNTHDLTVEASVVLPLPVLSAFGKPQTIVTASARIESAAPLKGVANGMTDKEYARTLAELRRRLASSTRYLPYYQRQQIMRQAETAIRTSRGSAGQVRLSR